MALAEVTIPQELADELEESFYQGPLLNEHGTRMLLKSWSIGSTRCQS
jgi:hypothetical protein